MTQQLLDRARENVRSLQAMAATQPASAWLRQTIADADANVKMLEAQLGIAPAPQQATLAAPQAAQQPDPLQVWANGVEGRLEALEGLVKTVAAPAIDEAAKAGMAVMSSLGAAMTPEQAAMVQRNLNSSPEFFATQDSKDGIALWLDAWQTFEGAKK